MKIEVVGPGCPFCKTLFGRVNAVVNENHLSADVTHVTDFKSWIRYIPRTPVLLVDGDIRHRGKRLPDKNKILELLTRT
jgi:hydrogenase maturation factor